MFIVVEWGEVVYLIILVVSLVWVVMFVLML